MKKGMSIREKVMLAILGVLCIVLVYYYAFYIPTQNEIAELKEEYTTIDDTLIVVEAKATRLEKMKSELAAIKEGNAGVTKPLPAYDNRQNLMSHLSLIMAKTDNYSITFGNVTGDGTTIRRQIQLNYSCANYEIAKSILLEIYNGQYPCTFEGLYLSEDGSTISVDITYFEYGDLNTIEE